MPLLDSGPLLVKKIEVTVPVDEVDVAEYIRRSNLPSKLKFLETLLDEFRHYSYDSLADYLEQFGYPRKLAGQLIRLNNSLNKR